MLLKVSEKQSQGSRSTTPQWVDNLTGGGRSRQTTRNAHQYSLLIEKHKN